MVITVYIVFSITVFMLFDLEYVSLPNLITGNVFLILLGPTLPLAFKKYFMHVYFIQSILLIAILILTINVKRISVRIILILSDMILWLLMGYLMSAIVY